MRAASRRVLRLALMLTALGMSLPAPPSSAQSLHFRYQVTYLGMGAGELEFAAHDSSRDGERLRVVHVRMKTSPMTSALFRIENEYRVVYNPATLSLLRVEKRIQQKNITGHWVLTYQDRKATFRKADAPDPIATWTVKGPVLDVISTLDLLIRMRSPDSSFTLAVDEEGVPMEASVRIFHRGKAPFASAVFRPADGSTRKWKTDILTNRFSKPGAILHVRFRKDRSKIPVEIRYSLGPATAKAKLAGHPD